MAGEIIKYMNMMQGSRIKLRIRVRIATSIILVALFSSCLAIGDEAISLSQYKPVAMDESVTLVEPKQGLSSFAGISDRPTRNPYSSRDRSLIINNPDRDIPMPYSSDDRTNPSDGGYLDDLLIQSRAPNSTFGRRNRPYNKARPGIFKQPPPEDEWFGEGSGIWDKLDDGLVDVEDSRNKNIDENLYKIPLVQTPALTKLITSGKTPTLVHDKVVEPTISYGSDGKTLAKYRILVPIFIPAVKGQTKVIQKSPAPEKYVTETQTKMVTVRKNVPTIKKILKAEKIPQEVITDFVQTDGNTIPSRVDDKLQPNERIISTTHNIYT